MHDTVGDLVDRTGHADRKTGADLDADFTAEHVDGDVGIDEAELVRDGGRGAGTAARGERVTGAALPDFNLNVGAVDDLEKLDVGLAREVGVGFEMRPVAVRQLGRDGIERDHAVRIADGGRAIGERAVEHGDLLVDDLALQADVRNLGADKTHVAHVNGDEVAVVLDDGLHMAAGRFDGEGSFLGELLVPQVTGKNAQAVAGFFGLGAVGIEDAQAEIALGGR